MDISNLVVTDTDRPVKIKVVFEVDPRDLVKIIGEIDFGYDREPGVREIRAAVRDKIISTGISHLLFLAGRRTRRADQLADTCDPGARAERSEHLLWCRKLVNRAFKPRRPRTRKENPTNGTSLLELL